MKKNKMMRIASVLLVAVLLSTCVISGTFAKYTTGKTGSATATVAKWAFEVGDTDIVTTQNFTFNLADTIKDSNDAGETDVKSALIAPGTKGSFDIVLENTSEVTAQYKMTFDKSTLNGAPFTFTYKVDGTTTDEAALGAFTNHNIAMNNSVTITVEWEWPFEANDSADMAVAGTELSLGITVNVEQVD